MSGEVQGPVTLIDRMLMAQTPHQEIISLLREIRDLLKGQEFSGPVPPLADIITNITPTPTALTQKLAGNNGKKR